MASTRCYRAGALAGEGFSLDDVDMHLETGHAIVWIDLYAPGGDELHAVADELGLHSLAVEDAATGHQRPKFMHYDAHDYLTAYAVSLEVGTGELVTSEIAAFITPRPW